MLNYITVVSQIHNNNTNKIEYDITNSIDWHKYTNQPANQYDATMWFETFMLTTIPKSDSDSIIWTLPVKASNMALNHNNMYAKLFDALNQTIVLNKNMTTNNQSKCIGRLKLAIHPIHSYELSKIIDIAISKFCILL